MNPTTSTINPNKKVYDVNGTKVRAVSQDAANTLASEIQTENTATPAVKRPIKATSSTSSVQEDTVTGPSFEDVQGQMLNAAQGELSYLDNYYKSQLDEQKQINQKNDRSNQAISTLTGLGGSTEADFQQQKVSAAGDKANKAILNEAKAAAQAVYSRVSQAATAEARAQRLEARQTEEERIKNRAARQQQAVSEIQNISASGITLDGLKKTDQNTYDYLVRQFGSEDALKGAYVLNTPQDQIHDKRIENGRYFIARQNPMTGKIAIESVDLGLPTGYSKTVDAGDKIIAIPDNWDGDTTKLIPITKGLTPGSGSSTGISPEAQNIINLINKSGGTVDDYIKGNSKDAQRLRNEVFEGLSKQGGVTEKSTNLFKEAKTIIDDMLEKKDYKKFGYSSKLGGQFTTGFGDMISRASTVNAILARDNLGLLKGAMSDKDLAFIQAMSSGVPDTTISEKYAEDRMKSIQTKLQDKINQYQSPESTGTTDQYATFRSQLQAGEVMVLRDGNVVAVTQAELLPTDQQI